MIDSGCFLVFLRFPVADSRHAAFSLLKNAAQGKLRRQFHGRMDVTLLSRQPPEFVGVPGGVAAAWGGGCTFADNRYRFAVNHSIKEH